jgi:hypothetical protein
VKRLIWPHNIFFSDAVGEVAHLLSASPDRADVFGAFVEWIIGPSRPVNFCPYEWTWKQRMKAVHGTGSRRREDLTGIKHAVANKIRMMGQSLYIDNNPCVLIVPILKVDEVKSWNGESYDAIVLPGPWEPHTISEVCCGIGMIQLSASIATEQ